MHKFLWTWIDQGVPWKDGNQSSASNWKTLIYEQIPPIEMAYFPFPSIFIKFPPLARIGIRHRVFQIPPAEPGATLAENRIAWHWQRRLLQPRLEAGRQLPGKPAPGRREAGRLVGRWLPLTNSWKQAGSTNLFSCVPSLSTFEWVLGGFLEDFLRMGSNLWVKPTLKQHVSETVNYKTKREAVILDLCVLVLHNFGRYGKWWPSDAFA